MNLRVDLILESEQRSGSVVNPKSIMRVASILVPLVVVSILAWQILIVVGLRKELDTLVMDWEVKQPQSEKAKTLTEEFESHNAILRELEGWRRSRISWNEQLAQLVKIAPENIQLQTLGMSQKLSLMEEKTPSREYTMTIKGRATGREAEESVRVFEQQMTGAAAFTGVVDSVTVPEYAADPTAGADRDDRIFQIQTQYKVQLFHEITRRRKRAS